MTSLRGETTGHTHSSRGFGSRESTFPQVRGPVNRRFYGLGAITSFIGIANLANVHEMQYAFSSCTGITSLDFRGFDPSSLTSLYLAFGSCSNLVTIYADSTWALPSSGLSGSQTFYNCNSSVGGNGTAYSSSKTGYTYMRIDATGTPGCLTAA